MKNNCILSGFGWLFLFVTLLVSSVVVSFGDTNTVPWNDNFENYTNGTPLINGTNGWFSSFSGASNDCAIVQSNVKHGGTQAAMIPIDVTLSNRFSNTTMRIVGLEMCVQPQLYNGTNYPSVETNVAAQFYVDSNGYFVVCNGTNWQTSSTLADGGSATPIANSYFTKVQVNLRYKNHTWNLKAWSNTTLVASTCYINFTGNLDSFNGFDIYNGNSTSYIDDVSVTNLNLVNKINGVRTDAIRYINGASPGIVNGVVE